MVRAPLHCRSIAAVVALLVATLPSRGARAQALLERFDPAERGSRFFMADSLELDGNMRLSAGVVASYGSNLRTFRQAGIDPDASELVEHSLWIHPGASIVLAPGARFALDVPVALQSGNDVSLDRALFGRPASPRMGDIRASFDVRLLGREQTNGEGRVLAVGVSAFLPSGSSTDYTGDDFTRFDVHAATAIRASLLLATLRVGYMYRKEDLPSFGGGRLGSELNAVIGVGYRTDHLVLGPEVHALTTLKDPFARTITPVEALLGAHVSLGRMRLGAGMGTRVVSGIGAATLRGVVSIEWAPAAIEARDRDRDRDGVPDADDACPDVAGLGSAPLQARGCPPPPRDLDQDGIIDADDACPDLSGVRTHDPMTHGCPDADRDGIPDPVDACPAVSGERSALPRFHGCPADADGDGILDISDACPDEPGIATDDERTNGCPLPPPDRDGDGVLDRDDACPDEVGASSSVATSNGCPVVRVDGEVLVLERAIELVSPPGHRPVRFAPDSVGFADVAVFVLAHPEIARIRVTARKADARAIVEQLVAHGVERQRLESRMTGPPKGHRYELRVIPAK